MYEIVLLLTKKGKIMISVNSNSNKGTPGAANACSIISGGGERSIAGNLIVSGKYSGKLSVKGIITLDADAIVNGEIVADEMIIDGCFRGTARVKNKIVFGKSSFFSGTIIANEAELYKGCSVTGFRRVTKIMEKEQVTEIQRDYGKMSESIMFSGKDDKLYMVW